MANRFVLLSSARSGTNLLGTALQGHPLVLDRFELFKQPPDLSGLARDWNVPEEDLHGAFADPLAFVDRWVFRSHDPARCALGLHLFYDQSVASDPAQPWQWLSERGDVRVIELQRRNQLRRYLSLETAKATGVWVKRRPGDDPQPSIELRASEFQWFVSEMQRQRGRALQRLDGLPTLAVFYEDLVANFAGEMGRIQDFLGIARHPLTSRTFKQNLQPLADRISNFAAFRSALMGTPYLWMLEDDG